MFKRFKIWLDFILRKPTPLVSRQRLPQDVREALQEVAKILNIK